MAGSGQRYSGSAADDVTQRDRELFSNFLNGDERAFKELYGRYERPLLLYCQYLLPTQNEAEEVFQETWLRIVRMKRRSTEIEHFRAFLFTVARNTALKHISYLKKTSGTLSLNVIDPENEWALASTKQHYSELHELVNRALQRLPVQQREAFVFHAMLGYTFDEIAEMQGVSMSAAKTRAFRARSYLRKLLSNWLGMAEDEDPLVSASPQGKEDIHQENTYNQNN